MKVDGVYADLSEAWFRGPVRLEFESLLVDNVFSQVSSQAALPPRCSLAGTLTNFIQRVSFQVKIHKGR